MKNFSVVALTLCVFVAGGCGHVTVEEKLEVGKMIGTPLATAVTWSEAYAVLQGRPFPFMEDGLEDRALLNLFATWCVVVNDKEKESVQSIASDPSLRHYFDAAVPHFRWLAFVLHDRRTAYFMRDCLENTITALKEAETE